MAKETPTLYSVHKTFIWFAGVSLVLTFSLVAIVYVDYAREWKTYQKKFIRLKTEMTKKELKIVEAGLDKKRLEELEKRWKDADADLKSRQADRKPLQAKINRLDTEIAKALAQTQDLKQFQDSYKYYLEETRAHQDPQASEYEKKLKALAPKLSQAKLGLERLEKEKEENQAALDAMGANERSIQKEIEKTLEEKTRLERKLKSVEPTLAKEVLNAPMVDFIAPSLRIQQIVLEDLEDDYHFARVQKVDRCTTCHLGIDQKGFSAEGGNVPQPFRAHPNLELYLGSQSPHPIEKFGCTTCHGGNGHSVSFKDSAHTPQTEAQKETWQKKYHWEELEKWEAKMLPLNFTQASCAKCHNGVVEVPKADKLNRGRKLAETHGCFNCHKVSGFEDRWKVGPDLSRVAGKLDGAWIEKWLEDPKSFRPSTKMPQVFHLSNTDSPEDRERNRAAIKAIAAYLIKNSEPLELTKPALAGNAENGEKLVKELGCLGCHAVGGVSIPPLADSDHGPELSNLGSKVTPEWLFTWLKDPKHTSTSTRMPNLRLSDQEASDIAEFLLSQKNAEFENKPPVEAKPQVMDELILASLQGSLRRVEAETELSKMTPEDKLQFLGKKSISQQGCYTCHAIKGYEDVKPIGADLSNEGRKDIHQFDFGFTKIERTRQAFIEQKLKEPRLFDQGKEKTYYDKLRMPQFNFNEEEVEALTTFILSLSEEQIPLQMQKRLDLKEEQVEKGRLLVSKLNCAGCHALDGKPGALRESMEDKGNAPPGLNGEGAKVQEKWLHEFLKRPTTIRPWLQVRMPTFGLTEEETKTLVEYFANLAHQEVSYKGYEIPVPTAEKIEAGRTLFNKLQCAKCHEVNAASVAMGSSFLAPDLTLSKQRLKPEWVKQWIADPQVLEEGTLMPTFFPEGQSPVADVLEGDATKQIEAIRDYLYSYEAPAKSE